MQKNKHSIRAVASFLGGTTPFFLIFSPRLRSGVSFCYQIIYILLENREFAELFFARSYRHEQAQSLRLSLKRVSLILDMKSRPFQPKRIRRTLTSVGVQIPATVRYVGRLCGPFVRIGLYGAWVVCPYLGRQSRASYRKGIQPHAFFRVREKPGQEKFP